MRLIDADEFVSNLIMHYGGCDYINDICEDLHEHAPTVDAVERKRGEWVKQMDELAWWYECSVCGDYPLKDAYGHESLSRFCPWCGADMRGEGEEE